MNETTSIGMENRVRAIEWFDFLSTEYKLKFVIRHINLIASDKQRDFETLSGREKELIFNAEK